MIEIGKKQTLLVVKQTDFGVYLSDSMESEESVLLPKKQVPQNAERGTEIEVFIYRDSMDRLIATVREPKLTLGQCAKLMVKEVGNIGAFMDWGLEKDLLLPFKEQTLKVKEGKEYMVCLYVDKSNRLCASMKLSNFLTTDHWFKVDDKVEATVYEIHDTLGAFVAVENKFHGLIPKKELHRQLRVGDTINGRIMRIREDGKLDLSLNEKAYVQMDIDAQLVLDVIKSYDGVLPFNDKAKPEVIERELGISKNAFKRAVGRLLKNKQIEITPKSIKLTEGN